MHHHRTAAVLLTALLLTSCSNSSDSKPHSSPSSPTIADEWTPKLKAAATADKAVCNAVGDQACAEHLTNIALEVGHLEQAIAAGAGPSDYPQTTDQITKLNAAVQAYTDHECLGDENAGIPGSPCPDDVQAILSGAEALPLALQADEK